MFNFTALKKEPKLKVMASPHLKDSMTTPKIMRTVLYSVLPICLFSIWLFGLSVLLLIVSTALTCVVFEIIFTFIFSREKGITVNDWSAVVTGVLLALTLPPGLPLWMAGVAGAFAMFIKCAFGGLGDNVFNPALSGRIFVQASFPIAMTTWTPPFALRRFTETIPSTWTYPSLIPNSITEWLTAIQVDGFSGATPLTLFKFQHIASDPYAMATGFTSGSTGETCAILIILCGLWLWWKLPGKYDLRIPVSVIFGAVLTGTIFWLVNSQTYPDPLFILTSGGLLFGAFFMATDPVGAPTTALGRILFGLFIGFCVIIIRLFGSWPEGVMCAILFGNIISPLINKVTQAKPYGVNVRFRRSLRNRITRLRRKLWCEMNHLRRRLWRNKRGAK